MDNRPIGIFDSGVGGLTVASQVMKELPYENIIYFGDTARVPYGSKSPETVTKFSRQMVNFLIKHDVKAIVAACNTVCTNSLDCLKENFDLPLMGMVEPGVKACINYTSNGKIGIIGTEATIRSKIYEGLIKSSRPETEVFSKACPLFVPLAEEGWTTNSVANITTEIYLQELIDREIDTLLLACTHYPLLMNCIQKVVGGIKVIDPAIYVAKSVGNFLTENNMLAEKREPKHEFYVSDNTVKFDRICKLLMNGVFVAQKIDIEQF